MDHKRIRSITTKSKIPSSTTRTITTAIVTGILVLGAGTVLAFLPPAQYASAQSGQPGQPGSAEPGQPGQPGSGGGEPGQPGQPGSAGGEPGEGATTEGATTEGATTEGATTEGATTAVCLYGSTVEVTEAQIRVLELLGIPFELEPCEAE